MKKNKSRPTAIAETEVFFILTLCQRYGIKKANKFLRKPNISLYRKKIRNKNKLISSLVI